ncbi:MAG: hypothetical protein IJ390_07195 [Lachnospiraceae bacterium]|nr:hypothetical protein [Lachnospiraceae bacterium]
MDKNIIIDLYYGRLNPMEMEIGEKEEFERHSRNFITGMEAFAQKLPPQLKEEFIKICEDEMKSEEILHRDGFCKGFELGLKMAVEALCRE